MSSVFSRIRSGASKAAFEADKLRRIAAVQSVIKSLKEEASQAFSRAGYVAFDLHRTGRITQPELREACERIASLQAQITAREREIETIRSQAYVEPTRGPQYGHLCPNGHGVLPPGAQFCSVCGAQAIYIPPQATGTFCPACGTASVPGARFCPKCGATVSEPVPPSRIEQLSHIPEESPFTLSLPTLGASCPVCGTALASEARFCPECGATVPEPPPSPPAAPQPLVLEKSQPAPAPPPVAPGLCPKCNASLVPEAVFCPDCGYRLVQSADAAVAETTTLEKSTSSAVIEPAAANTDKTSER